MGKGVESERDLREAGLLTPRAEHMLGPAAGQAQPRHALAVRTGRRGHAPAEAGEGDTSSRHTGRRAVDATRAAAMPDSQRTALLVVDMQGACGRAFLRSQGPV